MKNFWFYLLVVLFILAAALQWPVSLRIAVIANSILVLIQIFHRVWRLSHGKQI